MHAIHGSFRVDSPLGNTRDGNVIYVRAHVNRVHTDRLRLVRVRRFRVRDAWHRRDLLK